MSVVTSLASHELWSTLGVVLLHVLWQGALVALLVAAVTRALGEGAARERYAVNCVGLLALPLLAVGTWVYVTDLQGLAPARSAAPAGPGVAAGAAAAGLDPYAVCGWLWLAGAFAFQLRLAVAWFRAHQLRRLGTVLLEPAWQAELRSLGERLGLRHAVRVYASARIEVPALVGWLEPVVLVPAAALAQLTPDQLRAVLAHELAHLARFDPWINALQSVIESLLFFHPAVWWLSARIREEREYCCDDLALELVRDPLGYARALTSLESLRRQESALVLSSHGGSLMQRIRRITSRPLGAHGRRPLRLVPLVVSGLVLSLAAGTAHGWITAGSGEPERAFPGASPAHDGHADHEARDRKAAELEGLRRRVLEVRAQLDQLEAELAVRAERLETAERLPRSGAQAPELSRANARERKRGRELREHVRRQAADANADEFEAAWRRTFEAQARAYGGSEVEFQEALRRTFEEQRRAYERSQERGSSGALSQDQAWRNVQGLHERARREAGRSSRWPSAGVPEGPGTGARGPSAGAPERPGTGARGPADADPFWSDATRAGRAPLRLDARFPAAEGGLPSRPQSAPAPAAPHGTAPQRLTWPIPPGQGAARPSDPSRPAAGGDVRSWLEGSRLEGAPAPERPAPRGGRSPFPGGTIDRLRFQDVDAERPGATETLLETQRLREEVRRLRAELEARNADARAPFDRSERTAPLGVTDAPRFTDVSRPIDVSSAPRFTDVTELVDVTNAPRFTDVTDFAELSDVTDLPDLSDVTEAPRFTDVTELPRFTDVTDVTDSPRAGDGAGLTDVTNAPEPAEAGDGH